MKISKSIVLAVALSGFLSACATIENPEDCDIRCAFGKNAEFASQNEDMRRDLADQNLRNQEIAEQLNSSKKTEASLAEREANLRALLNKQSVKIDDLEKAANAAMARREISQRQYNTLRSQLKDVQTRTKMVLASTEELSESKTQKMASLVRDQRTVILASSNVLNVITSDSIPDNMG